MLLRYGRIRPKVRPPHFRLNPQSPLANGLVFAGLGASPGSTFYRDSSPYGNHGTLTDMDPATDWVWSSALGRIGTDYDGSDDYVACPNISEVIAQPISVAAWVVPSAYATNGIIDQRASSKGWCLELYNSGATYRIYLLMNSYGIGVNYQCPLGSPTHIGAVSTGATGTNAIHVNGTSLALAYDSPQALAATTEVLKIGRRADGNYFSGAIYDPLVHARILSGSEISSIADPSNVLLRVGGSDLIQGFRTIWPGYVAGAPPSVARFPWQQRRHRRMAGAR